MSPRTPGHPPLRRSLATGISRQPIRLLLPGHVKSVEIPFLLVMSTDMRPEGMKLTTMARRWPLNGSLTEVVAHVRLRFQCGLNNEDLQATASRECRSHLLTVEFKRRGHHRHLQMDVIPSELPSARPFMRLDLTILVSVHGPADATQCLSPAGRRTNSSSLSPARRKTISCGEAGSRTTCAGPRSFSGSCWTL